MKYRMHLTIDLDPEAEADDRGLEGEERAAWLSEQHALLRGPTDAVLAEFAADVTSPGVTVAGITITQVHGTVDGVASQRG